MKNITLLFAFLILMIPGDTTHGFGLYMGGPAVQQDEEDVAPTMGRYEPKPIPTDEDGFTRWDFRTMTRAFNKRIMLDGYRDHGHRDPAWDAAALQFLEDMIYYKNEPPEGARSREELLVDAERLEQQGCSDPLLFYMHGLLLKDGESWREAKRKLLSAAVEYDRRTYPIYLQCLVADQLQTIYDTSGARHKDHCAAWQRRLGRWLPKAMAQGIYLPGDERIVADHMLYRWKFSKIPSELEGIYDEILALPGLDPWVADVIRGDLHVELAWQRRGGGYANTVTEEGWQGFAEHLAIAREVLTRAWKAYPDRPEAPARMITLAMAGHAGPGETMRMWFDRAVVGQIDYAPAYHRLRWGTYPRWGGSHRALLEFGMECYRTGRYDTGIPYQLFRALKDIEKDTGGRNAYWYFRDVPDTLQELFSRYIQESHGETQRANYALLLGTAWRGRLYETAAKHLEQYGHLISEKALKTELDVTVEEIRDDLAHKLHPSYDLLDEAGRQLRNRNPSRAQELIEALREAHEDLPEAVMRTVRDLEVRANREVDLRSGEWVELVLEKDFPGWIQQEGTWRVREDGAAEVQSAGSGAQLLLADTPGEYFDVTGELEMIKTRYSGSFNAGFFVGDDQKKTHRYLRVTAFKQEQDVRWHDRNGMRDTVVLFRCAVEEKMPFAVEVRDREMTIRFGEHEHTAPYEGGFSLARGEKQFGIGGNYWYEGATIAFKNLRIRRVDPAAGHSSNSLKSSN